MSGGSRFLRGEGGDRDEFAALLAAYPFQREVLDQVLSFTICHPSVGRLARAADRRLPARSTLPCLLVPFNRMQAFPLARATLEPSYTYDDGREELCVVRFGMPCRHSFSDPLIEISFPRTLPGPASWWRDDDVQWAAV
jgi:hypothetical protein